MNTNTDFKVLNEECDGLRGFLIKQGAIQDPSIKNTVERRKKQKENVRYAHNTKKLLSQYRSISWSLTELMPNQIAEELSKPYEGIQKLMDDLDMSSVADSTRFNHATNVAQRIKTSMAMVRRLLCAVSALKTCPRNGELMYQIIYHRYMDLLIEDYSTSAVMSCYNLSPSVYYRLLDKAIDLISMKLWSLPKAEEARLLEFLEIIEDNDGYIDLYEEEEE